MKDAKLVTKKAPVCSAGPSGYESTAANQQKHKKRTQMLIQHELFESQTMNDHR